MFATITASCSFAKAFSYCRSRTSREVPLNEPNHRIHGLSWISFAEFPIKNIRTILIRE